MLRLVITPAAQLGIDAISDYISETSIERAKQYVDELEESMDVLCSFPASAPLANPEVAPGLHKKVFQKLTIVLYKYDEKALYILAVRDARSNWREKLV
jgi:plasmid stabilization system protein ParE